MMAVHDSMDIMREKNVGSYNSPFKCVLEAQNWDTINLFQL
jgi:hypothetical protein